MNKEELIKEYDEKAKALRDEFISKLGEDNKEFKLTYPKNSETVYYISTATGKVKSVDFFNEDEADKNLFEHGLYFNSKEEAERYLKECKLLFKLHQWAKLKNEGWVPDWSNDDEEKYYINYFKDKSLGVSWEMTWAMINFTKLPYFKSIEIVQECIDLFGNEIKEVLC